MTESTKTDSGSGIDWDAVKERLKKSEGALKRSMDAHPSRARAIMRRRAKRLAERDRNGKGEVARLSILTFRIAGEAYAVELDQLAEVAPDVRFTPIPGTPDELLGVTNLRGDIRPLLDPTVFLGLEPGKRDGGSIIFLRRKGCEVGLRVDAIETVRVIRIDELSAMGEEGASATSAFVRGVTRDAVILLNTETILSLSAVRGEDDMTPAL